MASVDQPFQTDPNSGDQNNQSGGSQSTSNSSINPPNTQISGGTGAVGGGPGSSQGPQNAGGASGPQGGSANSSEGTSSGAYPNLSKYMSANENWTNGSGQGLGQEVAGNLNNQGSGVNQSIQNAQNSFQNQGNSWQNNTQQAESGFQSGLSNPYAYTQGGNQNTQQASEALNASYQGPQNLFGSSPNLQQQTQNYVTQAGQTQTSAGQQNLLAQQFGGGGNYTQGQQTLDQSLLQTNPNSQQALTQANQQAIQTNQNLQNKNTQDQSQANAWTQYGQQAQQAAAGALNNTIGTLGSNYNTQFQNAQNAQTTQLAGIQAQLASGNITQDQAAALGITAGEQYYNINPGQYASGQNLTAQNTLTQDQYNQMIALGQLGGLNSAAVNPASSQYLQTYSSAEKPSTFYNSNNDIAYNQTGLQNAINTQGQFFNNQAATADQLYNNAQQMMYQGNLNTLGSNQIPGVNGTTTTLQPPSSLSVQQILANPTSYEAFNNLPGLAASYATPNPNDTVSNIPNYLSSLPNSSYVGTGAGQNYAIQALQNLANQYGYYNQFNVQGQNTPAIQGSNSTATTQPVNYPNLQGIIGS